MSEPDARAGWTPLTAEIGGRTYTGAWQVAGHDVLVVSDAGSRQQRIGAWDQPLELAQRLLIELHEGPQAAAAPPPPSPAQSAAKPAKPPNNLVGAGLLALFVALGAALAIGPSGPTLLTFAFVITGWILAVMAHEFAHAYVAHLGGDTTVAAKGYLAFDPRRYGDLGVTLVIPLLALALGGIGFPGGAVYIRNDLLRTRAWRAATAIAGPGATLLVLLVLTFALDIWSQAALPGPLFYAVAMLAFLQAMALILNLLPVPGLDGFGVLRPFLPSGWTRGLARYEGLVFMGLVALLLFVPAAGGALFAVAAALAAALGVPREAMAAGWDAFHFWR
jgi:Zn-dependent protease